MEISRGELNFRKLNTAILVVTVPVVLFIALDGTPFKKGPIAETVARAALGFALLSLFCYVLVFVTLSTVFGIAKFLQIFLMGVIELLEHWLFDRNLGSPSSPNGGAASLHDQILSLQTEMAIQSGNLTPLEELQKHQRDSRALKRGESRKVNDEAISQTAMKVEELQDLVAEYKLRELLVKRRTEAISFHRQALNQLVEGEAESTRAELRAMAQIKARITDLEEELDYNLTFSEFFARNRNEES